LSNALDPILPAWLPLPKFIRRDTARRKLRAMVQPMIDERRKDPEHHDDFLAEFVNAKLKDGRSLSDDEVLSLVTAMVFAGHETTAGQAAWTIIQLLQHPDYHARLKQEVDAVLPRGAVIDQATFARLQHAHWAVAETSRMRPSVTMIFRQALEDLEVGGFRIPKGWLVMLAPPVAQEDPNLFASPDRYDPLRFAPGREEDHRHRFAIISFGGGIHKCTGVNFANWEMAIIASLVSRELELELVTKSPKVFDALGAARPSTTIVRYRRREQRAAPPADVAAAAVAAGCPFHTAAAKKLA
jgi:sterol 14-demethylase